MSDDKAIERALLLQDLLLVLVSLWISHEARELVAVHWPSLKPAVPTGEYAHLLVVFLPTWGWCAERVRLQQVRTLMGPLTEMLQALLWTQAWGSAALAVILTAAQVPLNRSFIAIWLVLSTLVLLLGKLAQRQWVGRTRGSMLALVVGPPGTRPPAELASVRGRQVEVLESTDPAALRARLTRGAVDEVVIPGSEDPASRQALVEACLEAGIRALVRLDRVEMDVPPPEADIIGQALYLGYHVHEPDRPSLLLKAILDRVGSAVLCALAAPLMVALAILVRSTSRGPALFIQQRGGLNGRPFRMLKFRTMQV
ncbi:MAG: sugar transferase, partial [bacterium]